MNFFIDNNISPKIARALHELSNGAPEEPSHTVAHLRDKFEANIPDVEWISRLAEEGQWVVVAGDLRITTNAHEREAWMSSGMTAFFLKKGWMNVPYWEQARKLVTWWPRILDQARLMEAGVGYLVPLTGQKLRLLRKR